MRVVIDGNIGSGKSTQLRLLTEKGYNVKCEPIHDWPLKIFYEDSERWCFLLQMSILKSFCECECDIWERSPESSREVFWKTLKHTPEEENIYKYFYDTCAWKPDFHVYIRTSPEKCFERIKTRHQEGDMKISLDYLKMIDQSYERYISSCKQVLVIDGNKSPEEIHLEIIRCIKDVLG
jgi:deoxyadenosine/deoxycytidine kinase